MILQWLCEGEMIRAHRVSKNLHDLQRHLLRGSRDDDADSVKVILGVFQKQDVVTCASCALIWTAIAVVGSYLCIEYADASPRTLQLLPVELVWAMWGANILVSIPLCILDTAVASDATWNIVTSLHQIQVNRVIRLLSRTNKRNLSFARVEMINETFRELVVHMRLTNLAISPAVGADILNCFILAGLGNGELMFYGPSPTCVAMIVLSNLFILMKLLGTVSLTARLKHLRTDVCWGIHNALLTAPNNQPGSRDLSAEESRLALSVENMMLNTACVKARS